MFTKAKVKIFEELLPVKILSQKDTWHTKLNFLAISWLLLLQYCFLVTSPYLVVIKIVYDINHQRIWYEKLHFLHALYQISHKIPWNSRSFRLILRYMYFLSVFMPFWDFISVSKTKMKLWNFILVNDFISPKTCKQHVEFSGEAKWNSCRSEISLRSEFHFGYV